MRRNKDEGNNRMAGDVQRVMANDFNRVYNAMDAQNCVEEDEDMDQMLRGEGIRERTYNQHGHSAWAGKMAKNKRARQSDFLAHGLHQMRNVTSNAMDYPQMPPKAQP